ncbi:MAG: hypothetical protein NZL96_02460 [Patescibacteria group bacterium]|nr:hypothetical protein [Patescibacteria group bacterium]
MSKACQLPDRKKLYESFLFINSSRIAVASPKKNSTWRWYRASDLFKLLID